MSDVKNGAFPVHWSVSVETTSNRLIKFYAESSRNSFALYLLPIGMSHAGTAIQNKSRLLDKSRAPTRVGCKELNDRIRFVVLPGFVGNARIRAASPDHCAGRNQLRVRRPAHLHHAPSVSETRALLQAVRNLND
jgi:hypothetical protein